MKKKEFSPRSSTELSAKNAEIRRLIKAQEELDQTATELTQKIEHQTLKIQTQEEVIQIAKAEIDDYERMKPHPESEVQNLQTQIDRLSLENDAVKIKNSEFSRRITETSSLCNELRNKLKSAVAQRDQCQQLANQYETKFAAAERQLKELEYSGNL